MEAFVNFIKNLSQYEALILVLLIVFIVFKIDVPTGLAEIIDENVLAQVFIYLFALSAIAYSKPVIGVLALIASYVLIQRSKIRNGSSAMVKYLPSEDSKNKQLNAYNQFEPTLEESVVSTMAPIVLDGPSGQPSYLPILDNNNLASPIDYEGVI
jgi:hypothetical protein